MSQDLAACRAALKEHCSDLMSRKNVVATGIGFKVTGNQQTQTLSIICSVTNKGGSLSADDMVPQSVNGVPTDVIETGVIVAQQCNRQGRNRPAPGGVSLGHVDITAGTLGCLVQKNGETFILSNNHVIANSNDAQIGDPIIQPGNADGGSHPQDQIATLEDFVTIDFGGGGGGGGTPPPPFPPPGGCGGFNMFAVAANGGHAGAQMANTVDAAIARPIDGGAVENTICEIGAIAGQASATLGMGLKKSGRTTGLTTGTVNQVDVTVNVSYGNAGTAQFTNQLIAGAMSQGGDSGSAVLNDNNEIVGLLFAGSSTTTVINRIEDVFSSLGVTL